MTDAELREYGTLLDLQRDHLANAAHGRLPVRVPRHARDGAVEMITSSPAARREEGGIINPTRGLEDEAFNAGFRCAQNSFLGCLNDVEYMRGVKDTLKILSSIAGETPSLCVTKMFIDFYITTPSELLKRKS